VPYSKRRNDMSTLQKWFLITALWIVILLVGFVFYWTQVRPAKIRQLCTKEAAQACAEIKSSVANMLEVNQAVYSHCLKRNGLEK
jgi:flagellar biosynthesis/type III secretory pathway M-ring protein FliF/YscJ